MEASWAEQHESGTNGAKVCSSLAASLLPCEQLLSCTFLQRRAAAQPVCRRCCISAHAAQTGRALRCSSCFLAVRRRELSAPNRKEPSRSCTQPRGSRFLSLRFLNVLCSFLSCSFL